MIIKYINRSSHRPRLNHSRIWQALLDDTLHGNGSKCSRIAEEGSEDTDDTDSVESYPDIASIVDIDRTVPGILTSDPDISSPGRSAPSISSPAHTRSHGKGKKTKDREPFIKKGYGVVNLPGDINGLMNKLYLLAAEFIAGNTSVRNELVHVLDAFLRLKQLTRKEYADTSTRLAASL